MDNILEKINKAGLTLLQTNTPDETYTAIVKEAMRLVDAEYGSIYLGKEDSLTPVYLSDSYFSKLKVRKGGTIETAYKENKFIIKNIDGNVKIDPSLHEKGIHSVIAIPLTHRNEIVGVLALYSLNKEFFNNKQVDTLRVFGSMASFAIKKAQSYSETKKALEIRDMFISMAAHELRTPLTSISGYIQLLYSKLSTHEGSEGKWIRSLYEENKRMMNLVKEILEVNRIRAGQLEFRWQECDIDVILNESIHEVNQHHPGRQINYKKSIKHISRIIGDGERLTQAFDNVIDNALKYSPIKTSIDITLSEKGNLLVIKIKDTGKGIEEKDLPNIFEGHHKGGGGEEGFGIGLFFVENVIRQHRGAINIKSKLKKGTTVEIRLPKSKYRV